MDNWKNAILASRRHSEWCLVDIYNKFIFRKQAFRIDESVEEYVVEIKPVKLSEDRWNEWENIAKMDKVLVVETQNGDLAFFNQNIEQIDSELIKQE